MPTLRLDAGDRTESLVQFVLNGLDDATLDDVDVRRDIDAPAAVASEPITTAVLLTLAAKSALVVVRLVERWMEQQRQLATLRIVADGFAQSTEAGEALARVSAKHAEVSVSYGLANASKKAD